MLDLFFKKVNTSKTGSNLIFVGTVRNSEVKGLEIVPKEGLIDKLKREAKEKFDIENIEILHKSGILKPGEIILIIAVSSKHRDASFKALNYVIDQIKEQFSEKELFVDFEKPNEAILVIDMLNDFILPNAPLEVPEGRRILPKLKELLTRARGKIPIIYICDSHDEDDDEFKMWPKHCIKGTNGARVVDDLKPQEGDIIVEKQRYDGFFNTTLEFWLSGIKKVYITGLVGHICVFYTAASAAMRGYEVYLVEDCIADVSDDKKLQAFDVLRTLFNVKIIKSSDFELTK